MITFITKLLASCALIYGLVVVLMYSFQRQLIFHPQPIDSADRDRFKTFQIEFDNQGTQLSGWYIPHPQEADKPLLIYYGGNAEEISWNIPYFQRFLDASLLLVNYRGYGDSQGSPSEKAMKSDALIAFDQATKRLGFDSNQAILMGRSLGSGVATYVASQRSVAAVILVTGYDSLVSVASSHYPFLPVSWLLHHRFESERLAPEISSPLLNLVAQQDQVVPPDHGYQLAKQWKGEVQTLSFPTANHLTITDEKGYWLAISEFIQRHSH